ncbi:MAG TPA: NPCBM/NEW2 domain-containing protein [Planctomycetota bacterium]
MLPRLRFPALFGLLVFGVAGAPARAAAPAQEAPGPRVVVLTPKGEVATRFLGWATGSEAVVPEFARAVDDWLEVRFEPFDADPAEPASGSAWQLELAGGGWLRGRPGPGEDDLLLWRMDGGLDVPVDALWIRRLGRGRLPPRLEGEEDRLLARLGDGVDRRNGWLLGWTDTGLEFEDAGGTKSYSWEKVDGLQLVADAVEAVAGAAPSAVLLLRRGGLLAVSVRGYQAGAEGRSGVLQVALPWGQRLSVPLANVAAVRRTGGLQDLAGIPPAQLEGPGVEGFDWTPRADRSVEGRPMRVAGRAYARGFGTRVPSRVAWDAVGPGRLVVRVGIDDEVALFRDPQPVVFRVLFDGREIARTPPVRHGEAARLLGATLPASGRLELVADPAGTLPFGGHADWLDPLLLPPWVVGPGR